MNESPAQYKLMTCTGCSLLCNDVKTEFGVASPQFAIACEKGKAFLKRVASPSDCKVLVDGNESSMALAIGRIVADLDSSKYPLICGLADQSCETQLAAIELARQLNAAIDWTTDISPFAWHSALQQTGRVSCSISEINQSADLVLIWAADPDSTHPRFLESYAAPVIVIASDVNETSQRASRTLNWSKAQQQAAMWNFRERLAGITPVDAPDDDSFREQWAWLEQQLTNAKYPVIVVDDRFAELHGNVGAMSLSRLVRSQNKVNHCRLVNLESESNRRGALETFTSQTGAPFGILFREREPLFRGRDASAAELIRSGTLDLILIVGHAVPAALSEAIANSNARTICIGSAFFGADVLLPTKRWGVDEPGNGMATDGTPVHAPAFCESALPGPPEIIEAIRLRIQDAMKSAAR